MLSQRRKPIRRDTRESRFANHLPSGVKERRMPLWHERGRRGSKAAHHPPSGAQITQKRPRNKREQRAKWRTIHLEQDRERDQQHYLDTVQTGKPVATKLQVIYEQDFGLDKHCLLPSLSDPEIHATVQEDLFDRCCVSDEEMFACMRDFAENNSYRKPVFACGSCGIRDLWHPANCEYPLNGISPEHWLVNRECPQETTVEMYNAQLKQEKVTASCVHSYYPLTGGIEEEQLLLHLHPEFVVLEEVMEEGEKTKRVVMRLCRHCYMAAQQPMGKPPPQSLAAGCDYGVLSRIRINCQALEMPNALEALAIADVRLYSVVAKVYVPDAALMPARNVLHCLCAQCS